MSDEAFAVPRDEFTQQELNAVLRQDFGAFSQKAFHELAPALRYHHNWHLDAIGHVLNEVLQGRIKRLLITLPPRSLKSHFASIAFPAWALGKFPGTRIINISYAQDLTTDHSHGFRKLVRAPWYRGLFPGMRIDPKKDTESELKTLAGGYRYATTISGSLTGRGGSIVIIDDPIKAADAESVAVRTRVKEWFDRTLLTRLDDKKSGAIILVMQRLHVDDLAGHVLQKEGWVHLNLPAIAEEAQVIPIGNGEVYERRAGELLHPRRESFAELERLKLDMGSAAFSAQYQQSPIPAGGNMIKRDWFRTYDYSPERKDGDRIVQSWDTATKGGELNDYSVGITARVRGEKFYILDVIRKRMAYPELKKRIIEEKERWDADEVLIEDKGSGETLNQDLPGEGCHTIKVEVTADKQVRMSTCSGKIEAGAVYIPHRAHWLDDFMNEVLAFPDSRFDDQVDAFSQLLNRKRPFLYTDEAIDGLRSFYNELAMSRGILRF